MSSMTGLQWRAVQMRQMLGRTTAPARARSEPTGRAKATFRLLVDGVAVDQVEALTRSEARSLLKRRQGGELPKGGQVVTAAEAAKLIKKE